MIHCRQHLINWLIKESKDDVLLNNALLESGMRVELLGTFDPLPNSKNPGWLVDITSYRGRKDLIAIVKDYLGRPVRWYIAGGIDWGNWYGLSNDVLLSGDNPKQNKISQNQWRQKYAIKKRSKPPIVTPD